MKKILLTGSHGMLATDFKKYAGDQYEIIGHDKETLDITNIQQIEEKITEIHPDLILNCAAYTAVDDAEDIGKKLCFDINTLGVYNLAKISAKKNIDFITLSTDYVFDGTNKDGYQENDLCNPINEYGISKYLGEIIAKNENKNSIIIRTSWLYGGGKQFKNFVNTMLTLSESKPELKIIHDQFGIPTSTKDLSFALFQLINQIEKYRGNIMHFANTSEENGISWYDFTKEIFFISNIQTRIIPCTSEEYITKAKRPKYSMLINTSNISLRNWKEGLTEYLKM